MTEHGAAPHSPTRGHGKYGAAPEIYSARGLPVPWVTRWFSELRSDAVKMTPKGIVYAHEIPEDRELGVLWLRHGVTPGLGEPQWKEVHSYRQRDAMIGPCCQVCGRVIEGKVTWLTPDWALKAENVRGRIRTSTPPTCEDCIEVARRSCPHLSSRGSTVLDVHGFRLWGFFGDVFLPQHGKALHTMMDLQEDDERLKYMLAKQAVVEIYDFRKRKS